MENINESISNRMLNNKTGTKRVLNNEYHILSFEAKDIYELSCFDKDGNECENVIWNRSDYNGD